MSPCFFMRARWDFRNLVQISSELYERRVEIESKTTKARSPAASAALDNTTLIEAMSEALSIWYLSGDLSPRSQEYMSTYVIRSVSDCGRPQALTCSLIS